MRYQETAVEIEKEIEKFNRAQRICRFVLLCINYHLNLCRKTDCSNCKFILEHRNFFLDSYSKKNSEEMIDYSQQYCRKNDDDFYLLSCFLRSLIAIERGRLELENKLKKTLEKWNANIKI